MDGRTGNPAVTRLNPGLLRSVADVGGGRYFELSNLTATAANGLAAEVERLEQTNFTTRTTELPVERFQVFAAIAFTLLLFERFVPETGLRLFAPRRAGVLVPAALLVLVILIAGCSSTSFNALMRDGNEDFDEGRYEEALDSYRDAQVKDPGRAEADYNAGNALYRNGEFDRAAAEFLRGLDVADGDIVLDIYFNLGNARFREGRYDDAVAAYRQVLLLDSDHLDAKVNLELAQLAREQAVSPDPGDGSAEPEAGLNSEQTEGEETEEGSGDSSNEGEPGESEADPEGELSDAVDQLGERISIEEALAILDRLEELQADRDSDETDIVGIDDY